MSTEQTPEDETAATQGEQLLGELQHFVANPDADVEVLEKMVKILGTIKLKPSQGNEEQQHISAASDALLPKLNDQKNKPTQGYLDSARAKITAGRAREINETNEIVLSHRHNDWQYLLMFWCCTKACYHTSDSSLHSGIILLYVLLGGIVFSWSQFRRNRMR